MQVCNNYLNHQRINNSKPVFKSHISVVGLHLLEDKTQQNLIKALQAKAVEFASKAKEFGMDFFSGICQKNSGKNIIDKFIVATGNDSALALQDSAKLETKKTTIDIPLVTGIKNILKSFNVDNIVSVNEFNNPGAGRIIRNENGKVIIKLYGNQYTFGKQPDGSYLSEVLRQSYF